MASKEKPFNSFEIILYINKIPVFEGLGKSKKRAKHKTALAAI